MLLATACGSVAPLDEGGGGSIAGGSSGSGGRSSGGGASGGGASGGGASGGSASGGTSPDGGASGSTSAEPAEGMQILYEGEDGLSAIALDERFVYWGSSEGLRQAPLGGGVPVSLASGLVIRTIVPSGDYVYFAQDSFGVGQVARVPRAGGEVQRIADSIASGGLAMVDGHLYWTDPGLSTDTGKLFRATLDGEEVTLLAEGLARPSAIALDADHVYFASSGHSCSASPAGGSSCSGGGIDRIARSGGLPERVIDEAFLTTFQLNAGELYWFASNPPRMMAAPPLGVEREIVNVLAEGTGSLTSDGAALYWGSEDKVLRLPFDSDTVTRLATNLEYPGNVAVQGNWVYVAEASGRILRVATDGSANRPSGPITGPCPEPVGTLEELALTPRADTNLEQLALSIDADNVTASQARYERVVADVAAIRALVPDRADIGYRGPHDGKTLYLGVTEVAGQSILAGEYSAWDCLNPRYGASVGEPSEAFSGNWSLHVTLRGIYGMERIAQRYAELPGVTAAEPSYFIGGGPSLCAAADGERYEYVVDRAGGDCPAGCTEHDALAFTSEAPGMVTAAGAWNSAGGEPAPEWFAICR